MPCMQAPHAAPRNVTPPRSVAQYRSLHAQGRAHGHPTYTPAASCVTHPPTLRCRDRACVPPWAQPRLLVRVRMRVCKHVCVCVLGCSLLPRPTPLPGALPGAPRSVPEALVTAELATAFPEVVVGDKGRGGRGDTGGWRGGDKGGGSAKGEGRGGTMGWGMDRSVWGQGGRQTNGVGRWVANKEVTGRGIPQTHTHAPACLPACIPHRPPPYLSPLPPPYHPHPPRLPPTPPMPYPPRTLATWRG